MASSEYTIFDKLCDNLRNSMTMEKILEFALLGRTIVSYEIDNLKSFHDRFFQGLWEKSPDGCFYPLDDGHQRVAYVVVNVNFEVECAKSMEKLRNFSVAHNLFDKSPEPNSCLNRAQLVGVGHEGIKIPLATKYSKLAEMEAMESVASSGKVSRCPNENVGERYGDDTDCISNHYLIDEILLSNAQNMFDKMPIPTFMLEMAQVTLGEPIDGEPELLLGNDHDDQDESGYNAKNGELEANVTCLAPNSCLDNDVAYVFGGVYVHLLSDDLQLVNAQKVLDEISEPKHKSVSPPILSLESKNVITLTPFQVTISTHPFVDVENEVLWWGENYISSDCVVWKTMSDSIGYEIVFDPGILPFLCKIAEMCPILFDLRNGWKSNISYKEAHSWGNSNVGLCFQNGSHSILEFLSFHYDATWSSPYNTLIHHLVVMMRPIDIDYSHMLRLLSENLAPYVFGSTHLNLAHKYFDITCYILVYDLGSHVFWDIFVMEGQYKFFDPGIGMIIPLLCNLTLEDKDDFKGQEGKVNEEYTLEFSETMILWYDFVYSRSNMGCVLNCNFDPGGGVCILSLLSHLRNGAVWGAACRDIDNGGTKKLISWTEIYDPYPSMVFGTCSDYCSDCCELGNNDIVDEMCTNITTQMEVGILCYEVYKVADSMIIVGTLSEGSMHTYFLSLISANPDSFSVHSDLNGVQLFDPGGLGLHNWSKTEYTSECLTWWYNCIRGQCSCILAVSFSSESHFNALMIEHLVSEVDFCGNGDILEDDPLVFDPGGSLKDQCCSTNTCCIQGNFSSMVWIFDPGGNDEFLVMMNAIFAADLCSFGLHGCKMGLAFLHHEREVQGNDTIFIFDPDGQALEEVAEVINLLPKECLCFHHICLKSFMCTNFDP